MINDSWSRLGHVKHFLDVNNSFIFAAVALRALCSFLARKWRAEAIYQNDEVGGKQLLSFTEIPAGFRSFKKVKNVASN